MMLLRHRGYVAYWEDNKRGRVCNISRDVILFQADSRKEAIIAFEKAVDDYLDKCRKMGELPEVPQAIED